LIEHSVHELDCADVDDALADFFKNIENSFFIKGRHEFIFPFSAFSLEAEGALCYSDFGFRFAAELADDAGLSNGGACLAEEL
jgi:hypothetical protein